ncbi:MAG: galactose-1-epimerase [Prevotellaceae bacterium]|nr:galactose-1-epimerase [Prevotellaceae bacterium]
MNSKFKLMMALALGVATSSFAQFPMRPYKSTVVNEDGTVTFQYRNNKAKSVSVDVQFAGKNEMQKDQTGMWKVTLGPAAADMYPYNFVVDGVSIMDPQCEQYFPNEGFKNSLLEIPGKSALPHDIKNVPHGCMEYVNYFSKSLNYTNNAIVYLPPSYYKEPNKKYPVFYLISGTTDTEEVYYKVGRVNYILDNLIAEGKAKEMIVVLPYGNPYKLLPVMPANQMPMTGFGQDVFSNDFVNDLMPYIESTYRTINDRENRAIGGFSRGGNQGLSNGLHNLDKFSYLCSYSSFTSMDIPGVYDNAEETNKKINLFWLGVGTDDFLYGNARDYTEFLDQKGIRSVKEYTHDKFGHTWMNAKYFLDHTLQLLFNPEASKKAMDAAQPTLAKTGKEQQFTPGVMARLFPKQIVSPEYGANDVTYNFKAPEATSVLLESELLREPLAMQKDNEGVWSVKVENVANTTFKYCFVVDGTKVADPNNMYLSPDKGFKYSISKAQTKDLGDVKHGIITYNYGDGTAVYHSAGCQSAPTISLVIGMNDTYESWFKVGGVDDIADRLVAEGKVQSCAVYVGENPLPGTKILRADDFSTWTKRSKAFEDLLLGKTVKPMADAADFKTTIDGKAVDLYTLSNDKVTVQITNFGGFVVSMLAPDRDGNYTNIVTHYDNIEGYKKFNLGMVGPSLGRFANRIANAKFTLDGKEYNLTKNSGQHILHGGKKGFDHVVWDVVSCDGKKLVMKCVLPDGEDGFPGNLTTTLTYSLTDDNGLSIAYEATTDKPTVVNLSNHSYFNLNGTGVGDIMNHTLNVNAARITETTQDGIPTGKFLDVTGTAYDFRNDCRIGDRQMQFKGGFFPFGQKIEIPEGKVMQYDNNFCVIHKGKKVEKVATLYSPESGRVLEVWNDHPGLQVYTGARTAIALESQMYPDSPNHKEFPSTVLRPGKKYTHTCIYKMLTL